MTERAVTQRPWNERPEQADKTVAVLEALGFYIQLPDMGDQNFNEHGDLMSESFTKNDEQGITERVTVDYRGVRTYRCMCCNRVGLAADKYTHEPRMREIKATQRERERVEHFLSKPRRSKNHGRYSPYGNGDF